MKKLDSFLGGSMRRGTITDIYGPSGSGKTQLLHQICALAADAGVSVAYVDTTGNFRPERVLQMCRRPESLERIATFRAMCISDQMSVHRTVGDVSLLAVDNITDLFLYEYGDESFTRNRLFMRHMLDLSYLALNRGMPVIVTNMIRQHDDSMHESMYWAADVYTHIKVRLSGYPDYTAECQYAGSKSTFGYVLESSGVLSI